ncbi:hypothetical protein FOZ63_030258, partial [Perkinsus olseni]
IWQYLSVRELGWVLPLTSRALYNLCSHLVAFVWTEDTYRSIVSTGMPDCSGENPMKRHRLPLVDGHHWREKCRNGNTGENTGAGRLGRVCVLVCREEGKVSVCLVLTNAPTRLIGRILPGVHGHEVLSVALHATKGCTMLATVCRDKHLRLFSLFVSPNDKSLRSQLIWSHQFEEVPCRVSFSEDGCHLLLSTEARHGSIWDERSKTYCFQVHSTSAKASPELVCERNNAPFDLGAIEGTSPEGHRLFICGERVALAAAGPYQSLCVWAVPKGDEAPDAVPRVTIRLDLANSGMAHLMKVFTAGDGTCKLALSCSSGHASSSADHLRIVAFNARMTRRSQIVRIVEVPSDGDVVKSCGGGAIVGLEWVSASRIAVHVRDHARDSTLRKLRVKILSHRQDVGWCVEADLPGGNAYSRRASPYYLFLSSSICGHFLAAGCEAGNVFLYSTDPADPAALIRTLPRAHSEVVSDLAWASTSVLADRRTILLASACDDASVKSLLCKATELWFEDSATVAGKARTLGAHLGSFVFDEPPVVLMTMSSPASVRGVDIAWRHPSRRNSPRRFRGILTCLLASIVAISYTIFLLPLAWPLLPLPTTRIRELYRRWIMTVQLLYFGFIGGLVELFCGIRLVITGSEELRDGYLERPLVISNINNGLDAMSMICLCLRLRRLSTLKFIVDDSWRRVPIIGWAMQMMLFPFVHVDAANQSTQRKDRSSLRHHIEYLAAFNDNEGITLAMYPETYVDRDEDGDEQRGTTSSSSSQLRYTSRPWSALLTTAMDALRTFSAIDCCLDVTTGTVDFQPFERATLGSMWRGRFLERREHVREWTADRFELKEDMLQRFYSPLQVLLTSPPPQEQQSSTNDEQQPSRVESSSSSLLDGWDGEEAVSITSNTSSVVDQLDPAMWFSEGPGEPPLEEVLSKEMKFVQYAYTSYMLCFVVALIVHLLIGVLVFRVSTFVLWTVLTICATYAFVTFTVGGFDVLELEVWPRKRNVVLPSDGPLSYGNYVGAQTVGRKEEYAGLGRGGYDPPSESVVVEVVSDPSTGSRAFRKDSIAEPSGFRVHLLNHSDTLSDLEPAWLVRTG